MNTVKFRPVGRPSAPIVKVRVLQTKAAISRPGRRPPTVKEADREMSRRGFVRAGVRHV